MTFFINNYNKYIILELLSNILSNYCQMSQQSIRDIIRLYEVVKYTFML